MAINTINWSIASVYDADTNVVTVTDSTTYPVASNLVYLPNFSFYKAGTGDEEITPVADNAADNLITSWTFSPGEDGVYRMNIIAAFTEATILAENTVFTLGDTIVNGGNYYYYNSVVNSTDTLALAPEKWTLLTSDNFSNARFFVEVDTLVISNTEECLQEQQIKLGRELLEDCGCKIDCDTETKIRTWLEGTKALFNDGDTVGAQKMIENAIALCNCLI